LQVPCSLGWEDINLFLRGRWSINANDFSTQKETKRGDYAVMEEVKGTKRKQKV